MRFFDPDRGGCEAAVSAWRTTEATRSAKATSRTSGAGGGGDGRNRLRMVAAIRPTPSERNRVSGPALTKSSHCRRTSVRRKEPLSISRSSSFRAA